MLVLNQVAPMEIDVRCWSILRSSNKDTTDAGASSNDTRPRAMWRCKVHGSITWNGEAKRRRRLLAEFLHESQNQLAIVEQETTSLDLEIEVQSDQVTTLSDDLLFKILILLPAESLFRLQFVCKKWLNLINTSVFITYHAQKSETVLICQKLTLLEPGRSYFHVMDLDHGKDRFIESGLVESFDIRASCDGLVLATTEKNLILMNPVTRRHILLPLGAGGNIGIETFGVAFCNEAKTYKVVRLFRERSGCTSCDILNISTRKWTKIKTSELLGDIIRETIVSINGSLYWKLKKHSCDSFVSLNVQDENFSIKKLPVRCGIKDRLIEIGGNLGLVVHVEVNFFQVWILVINDDGLRENWRKSYNISLSGDVGCPMPICCSRNGKEMVFESLGQDLYVYDFDKDEMRLVYARDGDDNDDDAWDESIDKLYIPHQNTLVSWEDRTS